MEKINQRFPTFFKCSSKAAWTLLNKAADNKLGYGNEGANTYSAPIIDELGKYYFLVNAEISELVDLTLCVPYENITFKTEIL